jgi:hypothetical protein
MAAGPNTKESPFLPTWKLLNSQQKLDFVAGYIQGWRDAGQVLDIGIGFVRDNPAQALTSLERIKMVYDLSELKPDLVVREVDRFYADAANQEAGISLAITAAKSNLK